MTAPRRAPSPVVRNLTFDFASAGTPRFWHPRGEAVTIFFDALSTLFPLGERFFVSSVRAHEKYAAEAGLAADVRAFCGQEGVHGREHLRYNERLKNLGYPIDAMEAQLSEVLKGAQELPPRAQLAITCALEHFTALLAHWALGEGSVFEGADPTMAAIWRWHAAEESEHKAVAFDVYQAAGGYYAERVLFMATSTLYFAINVMIRQVRMMSAAGIVASPSQWAKLVYFLGVSPGVLTRIVPDYLRYLVPGFHPNDLACDALVDEWKRDYEALHVEGSAPGGRGGERPSRATAAPAPSPIGQPLPASALRPQP